jgi:hypothetical protein
MGFWTKSLRIFNLLCGNVKQSVRDIARRALSAWEPIREERSTLGEQEEQSDLT